MHNNLYHIQQQIAAGNEQALGKLYHLFYKKLVHFARAIVRSSETAEELVEDVFVKLWTNRSTITDIKNLTVYMYVAVKNRSLNELAKKAHELTVSPFDFLDITLDNAVANPHDLMITAEMLNKMKEAVDALPPRCKMIFKLIREDGLKYAEVAEILNISIKTIDAQMAIAVKRICTALKITKTTTRRNIVTGG
jgi:RNA polymerase sigma-70 factor (family 1)